MTPIDARLVAIRARLAAATPGPWFAGTTNHVFQADVGNVCAVFPHGADIGEHNTYLIAHAPADLAALLDRCDQLEQAGNTLADALDTSGAVTTAQADKRAEALAAWRAATSPDETETE